MARCSCGSTYEREIPINPRWRHVHAVSDDTRVVRLRSSGAIHRHSFNSHGYSAVCLPHVARLSSVNSMESIGCVVCGGHTVGNTVNMLTCCNPGQHARTTGCNPGQNGRRRTPSERRVIEPDGRERRELLEDNLCNMQDRAEQRGAERRREKEGRGWERGERGRGIGGGRRDWGGEAGVRCVCTCQGQ